MNEQCDARNCGAKAYVKADLRGVGTLYYCGHHGAANMDTLLMRGFEIEDNRSEILATDEVRPAMWAVGMNLTTGELVYSAGYIYRWKLADCTATAAHEPKGNKDTSSWGFVE